MKKQPFFGLIILLLGIVILETGYHTAYANDEGLRRQNILQASHQQAAPTPLPTAEPILIGYPTPEERVLPPIGSNAILVIGASVLVLIIIGGVLGVRTREKH